MVKKTIFQKIQYLLILITFIVIISPCSTLHAQGQAGEADQILTAAESHFTLLKERQYREIWMGLTTKTQESITERVIKESAKRGQPLTKEQTLTDFAGGGALSKAYWDAYVSTFNPDMALKESAWKLGTIKKDYAEVILQHKKAEKPAVLQLKKEGGTWKVGLEETFGILRWVIK